MTEENRPVQLKPLSPQQRIIMQHIINGLTFKEIELQMGIKKSTVAKYMKVVRKKYHCTSTCQCIAVLVAIGELTVTLPVLLTKSKDVL